MATEMEKQLAEALEILSDIRPDSRTQCIDLDRAQRLVEAVYDSLRLKSAPSELSSATRTLAQGELPPLPIEWRKVEDADGIQVPVFRAFQMWDYARAALASQPAARVALTDEQIRRMASGFWYTSFGYRNFDEKAFARAVIAEFCRINGITPPQPLKDQP